MRPASPGALVLRGGVAAYVGVLVLLPGAALIHHAATLDAGAFWGAVSSPIAARALGLTLGCGLAVTLVNGVLGTAAAWVLVRYPLPGRRLLGAVIDLPFALPTLVRGLVVVALFGPASALGGWLGARGISVAFAPPAVLLCLAFVSLPFVVRTVEPVLLELDPAEEEAAQTLGAGPGATFFRVTLPALAPAIGTGMLQGFARSLAEFGSVVIASGNIPLRTLTAPVYVFGEIEAGRSGAAAAVSVVLFGVSLAAMGLIRWGERVAGGRRG